MNWDKVIMAFFNGTLVLLVCIFAVTFIAALFTSMGPWIALGMIIWVCFIIGAYLLQDF